jgi:hypothetical protein
MHTADIYNFCISLYVLRFTTKLIPSICNIWYIVSASRTFVIQLFLQLILHLKLCAVFGDVVGPLVLHVY